MRFMQIINWGKSQKQLSIKDKLINEIKVWKRDAKKFGQSALYDLLSDVLDYIKQQDKTSNSEETTTFGFTLTPADKAFSEFIRKRDNYTCQKCGSKHEPNSKGLHCSHHFSRRYYNIRFDPNNAIALCHNCHNYWYQKDVPEAARWLEQKLGKDKIDRLIELKNQPQKKLTASEQLEIEQYWTAQCQAIEE